jgi:putative ABC transport system permease protein
MTTLMLVLLSSISVFLVLLVFFGLRNPVIARIALRNISRRWIQSVLMVAGLTLSTIMITSAISIGDSLSYSTRIEAFQRLGHVDEQIVAPGTERYPTLSQAEYADLSPKLQAIPNIDGIAPTFARDLAMVAPRSGQGEPSSQVFGTDEAFERSFGGFTDLSGAALSLSALGENEVYINETGAQKLQAQPGDMLDLYAGSTPTPVKIKAIVRNAGLSVLQPVAVMPLARAQTLFNTPDRISAIIISNKGDANQGVEFSDEVTTQMRLLVSNPEVANRIKTLLSAPNAAAVLAEQIKAMEAAGDQPERLVEQVKMLQAELGAATASSELQSVLADRRVVDWLIGLDLEAEQQSTLINELGALSRLLVNDTKARALEQAEKDGRQFLNIFLIMGTFSILVGMLLIFLLFMMLAAERRSEMGMARAVGLHRAHLLQMFVTEGIVYQLVASVIGVLLGIALSRTLVYVLGLAFSQVANTGFGRTIVYDITSTSIIVSVCLGLALSSITVLLSAWRISRLNIVAAIRDIPDSEERESAWRSAIVLIRQAFMALMGVGAMQSGYNDKNLAMVFMGFSLAIIGSCRVVAWLLKRTPLRQSLVDRICYTLAGIGLLAVWLLPDMNAYLGVKGYAQGAEMFTFSGTFLILGAIWVTVYNLDLVLVVVNAVFGRIGNLAPILKTAVSYPLVSKSRTGLALAMFSLIIFVIVMISAITSTQEAIYADHDTFTGGYQVAVKVSGENRIGDLAQALQSKPEVAAADIRTISPVVQQSLDVRRVGEDAHIMSPIYAPDPSYYQTVPENMRLKMRGEGFADAQAIWHAMQTRDDVALLTRLNVRSRLSPNADPGGEFIVEGNVAIEDETLPELVIEVRVPGSDRMHKVHVIGTIDSYAVPMNGIYTNAATMNAITGGQATPSMYMIGTREGVNSVALAQQLEKAFLTSGVDAVALDVQLDAIQGGDKVVFGLFKAFLALGLLVGIAALGVISSRNVVERRQQIGMMRAIGYQSNMVQLSFMIESSFVALLGIIVGTILGLILGANITAEIARGQPGVTFNPEWGTLLLILGTAYIFSLITTYLPARRAARVYPAEALRYE